MGIFIRCPTNQPAPDINRVAGNLSTEQLIRAFAVHWKCITLRLLECAKPQSVEIHWFPAERIALSVLAHVSEIRCSLGAPYPKAFQDTPKAYVPIEGSDRDFLSLYGPGNPWGSALAELCANCK
jgi:hypothetical protein